MPNTEDFRTALQSQLDQAGQSGASAIEVTSGALHRKVGTWSGGAHAMPSCCNAMYSAMHSGDVVVEMPPKGRGTKLTIRYQLPR